MAARSVLLALLLALPLAPCAAASCLGPACLMQTDAGGPCDSQSAPYTHATVASLDTGQGASAALTEDCDGFHAPGDHMDEGILLVQAQTGPASLEAHWQYQTTRTTTWQDSSTCAMGASASLDAATLADAEPGCLAGAPPTYLLAYLP